MVEGFLRIVSHKNVFLFLPRTSWMVDIVVLIIVTKTTWQLITKIGTKEDEESGLLMGFWRSLSGQPLGPDCGQQDAASAMFLVQVEYWVELSGASNR